MRIRKMKEIRFFKELSLDDIYVLTDRGISQAQLSRIERGIVIPSDEDKELIARALKEPVSKVFPKFEEEEG
jgi:transcriptional regulator with XRE-family HTH domain